MADKKRKSQAENAAASARAKRTKKHEIAENSITEERKNEKKIDTQERKLPVRFISSCSILVLFIIFLAAAIGSDGSVVKGIGDIICGLIGKVAFIVSIPVLLYMFYVHAFSGKRPIIMRTICLTLFVFFCGCIGHLISAPAVSQTAKWLYESGNLGKSGGILCGYFTILIKSLFGSVIPYIIFIITAVLLLLAGMQITIPSIIRAIQNRPRSEFELDREPEPEPAAVIVNHIANKRIANIERQHREPIEEEKEPENEPKEKTVKIVPRKMGRKADIFKQIEKVETPVAASVTGVFDDDIVEETPFAVNPASDMPPLERNEILFHEPDVQPPVADVPVKPPKKEKVTAEESDESAAEVAEEIAKNVQQLQREYAFPPIDLLKLPFNGAADGTAEMRENSRRLNETLASFKIEAHIINVTRGPSVTRYEVELEKGVRLNKLTTSADDIALSLGASGVRIAAVPGKISVVGIEVPNQAVTTVSLREVIDSQEFSKSKSKSSFAVGKDIGGNCIVGNIAKLPHMLIAGTTGSGKSVCMNSIILSLLYKASPEDVKLIMVDPKMVELGIYNGIPHLLIPVVTDPKKAAGSLQWAVSEMMRRYKLMSDAGVRDLESYNSIMESQESPEAKLPQVVVIIDELADLMLVAAKEVEESICRIAQMGRASGMHLIIATQRPSADVITGLMKANIPSRIAFSVASAMESRIILDTQGAEKLVGKGDMLYAPIGSGKPKRVQGCFVADSEVEAVATYVKTNYSSNYDQQIMEEIEKKAIQKSSSETTEVEASSGELDGDEMLPAAVDVILETGQASVSMLQRRLKLGYARAARIVDEMEEKGIVGPFMGSKPRAILITKDQWNAMRNGQSAQMDFDDIAQAEDDSEEDLF